MVVLELPLPDAFRSSSLEALITVIPIDLSNGVNLVQSVKHKKHKSRNNDPLSKW